MRTGTHARTHAKVNQGRMARSLREKPEDLAKAVWPCSDGLVSLSLSFSLCKMHLMIPYSVLGHFCGQGRASQTTQRKLRVCLFVSSQCWGLVHQEPAAPTALGGRVFAECVMSSHTFSFLLPSFFILSRASPHVPHLVPGCIFLCTNSALNLGIRGCPESYRSRC